METVISGLLHEYGLSTVLFSVIISGVVAFYRALKTGKLVPGAIVERERRQYEDRLEEARSREHEAHTREETWQKTAMNSLEASRDATDQVKASQAFGEAIVKALSADKLRNPGHE